MSSGESAAPTAKLQPTQSNEADPSKTSKPVSTQGPAILEEDDEFEDFPVEGQSDTNTLYPRASRTQRFQEEE